MASPRTFSIDDFVALRRVGALAVHPDLRWAAVVVERLDADRGRFASDLWRVPLGDGPAERLTRGEHKDKAPAFAADGTLYFLSNRAPEGGKKGDDDKRFQVWALPSSGEARQVTDEPLGIADMRVAGTTLVVLTHALPGIARDAQREAHSERKKHGPTVHSYRTMPVRFWDHWLGPAEPRLVAWDLAAPSAGDLLGGPLGAGRVLTAEGDARALHEASFELSADGKTLACSWATPNPIDRIDDVAIARIDTSSGSMSLLGVQLGVVHGAFCFAADGHTLAVSRYERTRAGYGARSLWLYDGSGEGRELTAAWDRWPQPRAFDGQAVLVTAEDEGRVRLFRVDLDGGVTALGPRDGSWHEVALAGARVVGTRSSILHPPEVVTLAPDGQLQACAPLSGFRVDTLPSVTDRRFDLDGRSVQAFVVEPSAAEPSRTLMWIHGGPVAAWLDQWHWRWSPVLAAAHGYRAVLPNPAGSTGFGLAWVNDVWGNTWGGRCHDDLMGIVDQLEAEGVHARDTVVMGGSFGGYMTNWIGGQTDRFRVLVTHASLFQLSTFHLATDVPAWWELMFGGGMWAPDADRYSPSRNIARWTTPTLVLHGERDYRVPVTEGLMLFEALQRQGVPSELAIFPDEHHWIMRPRNIKAWYETVWSFIDRHWQRPPGRQVT